MNTPDYLRTTRDVYAEAALSPDAALCCTTSPVWALPGLDVPAEESNTWFQRDYPITPRPIPAKLADDEVLRARCLSGAPTYEAYMADLVAAGFGTIEVRRRSPYRMLDARRYEIEEDILLDSVEVVAIKDPIPADGACIFTGRTAIWRGESWDFDDGNDHVLIKDVPLNVCDKTAAALEALDHPDIVVTDRTWHYAGGGCC